MILGKTNVPVVLEDLQTYNPIYGRTNNPWDLTRTPGGAPMAPALTYNRDLTVIGPMARSARDLEILLNLLTVQDPLVPSAAVQTLLPPSRHQRLADFRILIVDSHPLLPTSDETRHAIEDLAEHLTRAGTEVRRESALLPDLTENALRKALAGIDRIGLPGAALRGSTSERRGDPVSQRHPTARQSARRRSRPQPPRLDRYGHRTHGRT